jgi:hypothetical protein
MRLGQMPLLWVLAAVFSWLTPTAARAVSRFGPIRKHPAWPMRSLVIPLAQATAPIKMR